jgi:hypothetical protein
LRRAEGGAKILGYFVGKITILRQKILFFAIAEGGANIFGVFCVKNHDFTPKNHIFSNFRGGARWVHAPPLVSSFIARFVSMSAITNYFCQIYENVDIMFIEIYRIH